MKQNATNIQKQTKILKRLWTSIILLNDLKYANNHILANFLFELYMEKIGVIPFFSISVVFSSLLGTTDSKGVE